MENIIISTSGSGDGHGDGNSSSGGGIIGNRHNGNINAFCYFIVAQFIRF